MKSPRIEVRARQQEGEGEMYHHDRAIAEQYRGTLVHKRRIEEIYQDMMDIWASQIPSNNSANKRIRGPHNRALKRQKARVRGNAADQKER